MNEDRITYFAETDARNRRLKFGIKAKDRTRHVYVLGKTGMGKSTLLENMAVQDIQNGEGMCFIDPHGKTADLLMEYVPKDRVRDVIYIAPFDTEFPISFNVLESVDPDKRHLVVSGLMSTFKKIWVDAWSARMEYILTNTLLALLEAPGSTLLGVNRMLSDKAYRNEIISHIKDPSVKAFWTKEFAGYTERMAAEAVPAIQNKVGQFTANPLIRNMIGQPTSSFDFREAMDKKKIMIINLSKGKIGDENMKLLGGLLVTKIYLAAMSRADIPDRVMKIMPNFYLFVDEFQNFANASFADILSEARKYKLNLTIAHQYVEQMDEFVRPAVFGNVGTMIIFRVGASDAEILEKEFAPQFEIEDLVNLGFSQIYLKLMIDGLSSSPFSATTLPPIPHPDVSYFKDIIGASREQFAKPRAEVEEVIIKFHEPTPKAPPAVSAQKSSAPASAPTIGGAAGKVTTSSSSATVSSTTTVSKTVSSSVSVASTVIPKNSQATQVSSADKPAIQSVTVATSDRPTIKSSQPSKGAASTPVTKPAVPAQPASHQPFKSALGDLLKEVTAKPAVSPVFANVPAGVPIPAPKPVVPPVVVTIQNQTTKPVSLSSLSPKPISPRNDPKVPTVENVNGLKAALAAVLAAKPSQPDRAVTPLIPKAPVPTVPQASKPRPISPVIPEEPANEVPEDVLKKVLKV